MSDTAPAGEPHRAPPSGPRGRALRVLASTFGIVAGLLGLEHGFFEWQQVSVAPDGLVINAIGPPCESATTWHACEPAFTLIPDFRVTGALAMVVALLVLTWAVAFVERRHGGHILLLSVGALWLVGGGFVTLIVGLVAGIAGTAMGSPLTWWRDHLSPAWRRALAAAWPWILFVYLGWDAASWVIGAVANDFMVRITPAVTALSLPVLVVIVLAALAKDLQAVTFEPPPASAGIPAGRT